MEGAAYMNGKIQQRRCKMNTLHGLIQNKQYTSKTIVKDSLNETLSVFKALTLKEKCLYLIKISKRNTGHQTFVLMVLTLVFIAVDYLFSLI